MTSHDIKTAALCWLRFGRRYPYVCTEGGRWNADVLGATTKALTEIEVKVSKSDFKVDFVKTKHDWYAKVTPAYRGAGFIPNQMYYAVPKELETFALEYLAKQAEITPLSTPRDMLRAPTVAKYGLLVYDETRRRDDSLVCIKTAGKIHAIAPSPKVLENMLLRMGSELAGFHIYSHRYQTWLSEMKDETRKLSNAVDIDPEDRGIIEAGDSSHEPIPGQMP